MNGPTPRRSRSLESDQGGGLVQLSGYDGDAVMHHDQEDRTGRFVGTYIDTTQEAIDRGILRVAPEKRRGCLISKSWIACPTR